MNEKDLKHQDIIDKMTIEEKAAILSGKNEWQSWGFKRLDIPSVFCADGPHGIRKQAGAGDHLGLNESLPATCFPTAATVANSWDESLGEEIGQALGVEAAAQEVDILLGPGLNMKRSPLCGRNFEYFAEDPYLAGKMAASYVRGIQSRGVFACPKHFAVNSQELRRMAMNAVVDERTLREIYLTGFEIAVKEGRAKAIMSSYNEVNGVYANENKHLLQDILRDDWGFEGMVVTDWGGSNDHVRGVAAGSNLEMPNPGLDSARQVVNALETGTLTSKELDTCVDQFLDSVLSLREARKERETTFSQEEHHELARRAARESTVLLKNEAQLLPLKPGTKVALIGDFARTPRYQGAGSSLVKATSVETMEEAIKAYELEVIGVCPGYRRNGGEDPALLNEALELAGAAEVVLYCFGLNEISEVEGMDREHMNLPVNQIDLLTKMSQVNNKIVGVLSAGSAVLMPWHEHTRALLHGYLSGQAGASGILDLLTGAANPSGKLNETYPFNYEDTPAYHYFPSKERNSEYREGLYIGYRYYDTSQLPVQYPFGFGLSYTTFAYEGLEVREGGVKVRVTNTGAYDGAEVVQLYVGLPGGQVFRPSKELKGFKKIFIKKGESKEIWIPFDDKTFRYWNVATNQWEIEEGDYELMVGASSDDIRLRQTYKVAGTTRAYPYNKERLANYYKGSVKEVTEAEFKELYGRELPSGKWSGELGPNDAICQLYYAKGALARFAHRVLKGRKQKSEDKGKPDLNILFIYNMPFRALAKMTGGMVSMEMVYGILDVVNGHFFKGMGQVIGGFFRNRKANKAYEEKL